MASFINKDIYLRNLVAEVYYQGEPVSLSATKKAAIDVLIDDFMTTVGGGGAGIFAIKQISATYTILEEDYTIECTANSFDVTLADATLTEGQVWNIKNSGTGIITLLTQGAVAQTIDGQASGTFTLTQYESLTVQSNATDYIIL